MVTVAPSGAAAMAAGKLGKRSAMPSTSIPASRFEAAAGNESTLPSFVLRTRSADPRKSKAAARPTMLAAARPSGQDDGDQRRERIAGSEGAEANLVATASDC